MLGYIDIIDKIENFDDDKKFFLQMPVIKFIEEDNEN